MTKYIPFYYDTKGFYQDNKSFMITGKGIAFLTAFLNSSLFKFCFLDKIPVYEVSDAQNLQIQDAVEDIQNEYTKQKAQRIDSMLCDLYHLTAEERETIGFVEIQ